MIYFKVKRDISSGEITILVSSPFKLRQIIWTQEHDDSNGSIFSVLFDTTS